MVESLKKKDYEKNFHNGTDRCRAFSFAILSINTLIPFLHSLGKYGLGKAYDWASVSSFVDFLLTAIISVSFYLTKFPERFFRGHFNVFGASHQVKSYFKKLSFYVF